MSESKLKLWRNEEMACVRAEKAGAWVKMRRMAESAATLMRQMTYFIELLMLTGQHTCSNKARQMLMHISRQLQDRVSEAVDLVASKNLSFRKPCTDKSIPYESGSDKNQGFFRGAIFLSMTPTQSILGIMKNLNRKA